MSDLPVQIHDAVGGWLSLRVDDDMDSGHG